MIGLSVWKPTLGMARHSSGRSLTSAPDEKSAGSAGAEDGHAFVGVGIERLECLLHFNRDSLADGVQTFPAG